MIPATVTRKVKTPLYGRSCWSDMKSEYPEGRSDKCVAKEITKEGVEGVAWLLLAPYSKIECRNIN